MKILDTNMVLRFLLNDVPDMSNAVKDIIKKDVVLVTIEVIAEVVYVMKRVYKVERNEISNVLIAFMNLNNITSNNMEVIIKGLELYGENNLDFVDCILCAYHTELGYEVYTFDKKLNRLIDRQ